MISDMETNAPESGKGSSPLNQADKMHERLDLLVAGFEAFRIDYGVQLHVKDFTGYMISHPLLGEFTDAYLFHENSFCSYVKSFPEVRAKCVITSNELLMRKLQNRLRLCRQSSNRSGSLGFYGVCWCGVREYVYPVCHNGIVIGALLAGAYRTDERRLAHSFSRLGERYGLDKLKLRQLYDVSADVQKDGSNEKFELRISLFAEYLSMLAEYYIEYPLICAFSESSEGSTHRHKIISLAIDYISKNLSRKISVSDMALYCMCSKSTLNHTFSLAMGRSIPEFVSIQRVNRAKYLIMNTNTSIDELSTQCGFMSAAYFSVVFKKLTGLTPSEYRNRKQYRDT